MGDGKPVDRIADVAVGLAKAIGELTREEGKPPKEPEVEKHYDDWYSVKTDDDGVTVTVGTSGLVRVSAPFGWRFKKPTGHRDWSRTRREWTDEHINEAANEAIRAMRWREEKGRQAEADADGRRRFAAIAHQCDVDMKDNDVADVVKPDCIELRVDVTTADEIRAVCAAVEIVRLCQRSEKPLAPKWLREFFSMMSDMLRDLRPEPEKGG